MPSILLVDDNHDILAANSAHLLKHGYDVTTAASGTKALHMLNENKYDLIVLDIMLPDMDGFAICKSARAISDTPIIFLTCLDTTENKVDGLMSGADDYMTKPYSLRELTARITAILRRDSRSSQTVSYNNVSIDSKNRMIQVADKNVFLSQKEFELFMLMYDNPGQTFSKDDIFKAIWPKGADIGTVAVHILKLRRKLDDISNFVGIIKNDYKLGYFVEAPSASEA